MAEYLLDKGAKLEIVEVNLITGITIYKININFKQKIHENS